MSHEMMMVLGSVHIASSTAVAILNGRNRWLSLTTMIWGLAGGLLLTTGIMAACHVLCDPPAEIPDKVCVVQKRDFGGEWKCSEWRQP